MRLSAILVFFEKLYEVWRSNQDHFKISENRFHVRSPFKPDAQPHKTGTAPLPKIPSKRSISAQVSHSLSIE